MRGSDRWRQSLIGQSEAGADCRVNGTFAQDEVASKRLEADAPIRVIMSSSGRSSCANVRRHPQMSPYFQQLRAKIGHDLLLLPSVAAVIRNSDGRLLLQEKASGEGWSLPAGAIEPAESPA